MTKLQSVIFSALRMNSTAQVSLLSYLCISY